MNIWGKSKEVRLTLSQVRWAVADSLPASELDVAVNNKTIFMDWWDSHVAVNATDSCDGIILYSGGVSTNYRNQYLP